MSETPDYAALARQYLDLWEEHLTAVANDPVLAQQMAAMFGLMGQTMPLGMPGAASGGAADGNPLAAMQQAMAQIMAGFRPPGSAEKGQPDERSGSDTAGSRPPPGAAAAAAASGDGDDRLDELARRLADVEKQLAELAAGSGGRSQRHAGGADRGKSAGTAPRGKRKTG